MRRFSFQILMVFLPAVCLAAAGSAERDIRRDAAVMAVERVLPCVVNIATEEVIEYHQWYDDLLRRFYGWPTAPGRRQTAISVGSGVIIDEEGYVLTNFHVVQRASRIQVKLWDGREYDAERVVATSATDVALLKIRHKPGETFKAIAFAADDDLLLGETVLALGNPFGLGGAVTKGILSSKNRRPSTGNEPLDVQDWLQTDAAINPGNSGGPLVNLRGELIGLNVAVYREEDGQRGMGVGFSIPVKQISAALSSFFTPEVTAGVWFGAQCKSAGGTLLVSTVHAGSPAAEAGLQQDDRILEVNSRPVSTLAQFNHLVTQNPNKPVQLLASRSGQRRTVTVRAVPFQELLQRRLGITVETGPARGNRAPEGLVVTSVEPKSPAERAALRPGCIISGIDDQPTPNLRAAALVLITRKRGETATLHVIVPRRVGANYLEVSEGAVAVQLR